MVRTIKVSEQMRKEYHILPAVIMDAIDEGLERGKSLGLVEGEARGSRQKALETARILRQLGDSTQKIVQVTGLSQAEVEALY